MANPNPPYKAPPPPGSLTVDWPSNIDQCVTNWNEQTVEMRIRTKMSYGPPKTRRRFSGVMRRVSFNMELPWTDFVELRAFYEGDGTATAGGTNGGVKYFLFLHPYDGEYHYYRFFKAPKLVSKGAMFITAEMELEEN